MKVWNLSSWFALSFVCRLTALPGVVGSKVDDVRVAQAPGNAGHHRVLAQSGPEGLQHVHQITGLLTGKFWPRRIARHARFAVAGRAVFRQDFPFRGVTDSRFVCRCLAAQAGIMGREILNVCVAEPLGQRRHGDVLLIAGLVRTKYPGKVGCVLPRKIRPGVVRADARGAVTACACGSALLARCGVAGYFGRCGRDLGRMRIMANRALLAIRVFRHIYLRLSTGSSRHGFMALGAQFHRIRWNRKLAVLRMPLGRTMTYFADHSLVTAGRPLRVALGVTALAITWCLVDGFLGRNFRDGIGTIVTKSIERIDRQVWFRNHCHNKQNYYQRDQSNNMLGHARLSGYCVRPSRYEGAGLRSEKSFARFNSLYDPPK